MIISAKYENGVFKPLEDVKLEEGTVVEVNVPVSWAERLKKKSPSVKDFEFCGMWADREDMADSVEWVNKLRRNRGAIPEK